MSFVKQIEHNPVEPVQVERGAGDVLVVEGVPYAGDFFRQMAWPEEDCLYAIRRDEDGRVWLTVIRTVEEAKQFFEAVSASTADGRAPSSAQRGDDNAL